MKQIYALLGLALRAGHLVSGDAAVLNAIRTGEAQLVIVAEDASDATKKRFEDKCKSYSAGMLLFGEREALGHALGKEMRAVAAVTDAGFARSILQKTRMPETVRGGKKD